MHADWNVVALTSPLFLLAGLGYLLAREFGALPGAIAASLVLSTALAAFTTPVAVMLIGRG